MQEEKKINYNKVIVSIKDGYSNGDKLNLHTKDLSYSWNAQSHSLEIKTDDTLDLSTLIKQVYLEGVGGVDRFLDASFVNNEGEQISLKEYEIAPIYTNLNVVNNNDAPETSKILTNDMTYLVPTNIGYDNLNVLTFDNIHYEQLEGAEFLNYEHEEKIAFQVKNSENGDNIFKLLKDALFEQKAVELWGYDFAHDKLDLTDITNAYPDMKNLSFALSKHDDDVKLSIVDSANEYSVMFKEVSENLSNDNLDEVLNALILDSFNIKVGS